VATCRLDVHVTKGRADGLHVSSVGAAGELWAVIMDAGTQFTAQARAFARPGRRRRSPRRRRAPRGFASGLSNCAPGWRRAWAAPRGRRGQRGAAAARRASQHNEPSCGQRARAGAQARPRRAQVHCVAQRQFLPKDWIMEQWDAGYYITAIAGAPPPPAQTCSCENPRERRTRRPSAPAPALRGLSLFWSLQGAACAGAR
jgi:hypothetical protein